MMKPQEYRLIDEIAIRAMCFYEKYGRHVPKQYIVAELTICHDEICRLRLADMLAADDFNFMHDVSGIHKHIDLPGMKLTDCFVPRFAERQQ